jgi:hypothetical protein
VAYLRRAAPHGARSLHRRRGCLSLRLPTSAAGPFVVAPRLATAPEHPAMNSPTRGPADEPDHDEVLSLLFNLV